MPDLKVPRLLILMLCIGLILRLVYALQQDSLAPYDVNRGDAWWYLEYGRLLVEGRVPAPPPSAPLYLLVVGAAQHLFEPAMAIVVLRLIQVILSTVMIYLTWRLTRSFTEDNRPGLLAALALTLSPVFIIESAQTLTETLYIFLSLTGLLVYIEMVQSGKPARRDISALVITGLLLGLATLTRAVLLLFPVGLVFHLLLVYGWRRGLRYGATLLLIYSLVVSIWTVYNRITWNLWVIGAQGFSAFLYIGATDWQGPQATDQALAEATNFDLNSPTDVPLQFAHGCPFTTRVVQPGCRQYHRFQSARLVRKTCCRIGRIRSPATRNHFLRWGKPQGLGSELADSGSLAGGLAPYRQRRFLLAQAPYLYTALYCAIRRCHRLMAHPSSMAGRARAGWVYCLYLAHSLRLGCYSTLCFSTTASRECLGEFDVSSPLWRV